MSTTPPEEQPSDPTLLTPDTSPSTSKNRTRTVAIIKNHALAHRLDIEARIQEAGFEIVKERQMEFDTEADPEFMYELFGEDVDSLAEGPVWVYVLERRRAVEVWNALMGDHDPDAARELSPNSLRALYGISHAQNGFMGSPDVSTAEFQISTIFNSSPPFPSSDPDDKFDSLRSLSTEVLSALQRAHSQESLPPSSDTNTSTAPGGSQGRTSSSGGHRNGKSANLSSSQNGRPIFRARALPKTHAAPDIAPRTTKAAALRQGKVTPHVDKVTPTLPRAPLSKDALARTFANVPGHKRSGTIQVASTAIPTVVPRMTKAASLRINKDSAAVGGTKTVARARPSLPAVTEKARKKPAPASNIFEGVPGHKRRETIAVVSVVAPPSVAPKTNRSAMLRANKEGGSAPPSSFRSSLSIQRSPSVIAQGSSRTVSQTSRPASAAGNLTSARPVSLQPPSIAPRPNKSAMLRAAMQNDKSSSPKSSPRSPIVAKAKTKAVFV